MTLSIYQNGTQSDLTSPGEWDLVTVPGPGVFAAMVDTKNQDGVEVRLSWNDAFGGGVETWVEHRTVDADSVDVAVAILTPPIPFGVQGTLHLEVIAGTLGASFISWIVYKL